MSQMHETFFIEGKSCLVSLNAVVVVVVAVAVVVARMP
jgi:hypothetical protein